MIGLLPIVLIIKLSYYGEPGDFTARMAFVGFGQVELEWMMAPYKSDVIYEEGGVEN
jgi:hypothetical protein